MEWDDDNGEKFMLQVELLNHNIINSSFAVIRENISAFNFNTEFKIPTEKHPLITAIRSNSFSAVSEMLKYIHDVNRVPFVLHTAVLHSSFMMVELLVDNGAALDAIDENGDTALHLACAARDKRIFKCLIRKNADVHAENITTKLRPIHFITKWVHFTTFLKYSNIDLNTDDRYKKILHFVIKEKRFCIVRRLLTKYIINIEQTDENQKTPIYDVCDLNIVKMFITRNVKINVVDEYKRTPIHEHFRTGRTRIAFELLINNLDIRHTVINKIDSFGNTALHYILELKNHKQMVKLLIEYGAKLEYDHVKVRNYFKSTLKLSHSSNEMVVLTLFREFIVLELIKQNSKNIPDILLMEDYEHGYLHTTIPQLQLMMETKINNTNLSYFTVFTKSVERISRYMNNPLIRHIPNIEQVMSEKWPSWRSYVSEKYHCGIVRYKIKNTAREYWCSGKFNVKQNIPDFIIDEIFSYLGDSEIQSFGQAFKNH